MPEKLSAKFARQESEEARLARIARRRIREDQVTAVRKMLGLTASAPVATGVPGRRLLCPTCRRRFAMPMHLGRHLKAAHPLSFAASSENEDTAFPQLEHQRGEADAGQAPEGADHRYDNVAGQPEGPDHPLLEQSKD